MVIGLINYRGTISSVSARKDFCNMFGSSEATVSNMVSKLSGLTPKFKHKLLVKDKSKTVVNKALKIDFSKDIVIRMFMNTIKETVENGN